MTKEIFEYVDYLYDNYNYIVFNAPRNSGKTTAFVNSISNDLINNNKSICVILYSDSNLNEIVNCFLRKNSRKYIKEVTENRILFKNNSIIHFFKIRNIDYVIRGNNIDSFYFDNCIINDSSTSFNEFFHYVLNNKHKIIFNDCLFENTKYLEYLKSKGDYKQVYFNSIQDMGLNMLRNMKLKKIMNKKK